MGRLIILGLLLFLAVSFIAICVGMYIYMKRTVKNGQTLGIGAGQMNRVGSCKIALEQAGALADGAVLASDAFFPMRDSADLAAEYNIAAIVQPGGSIRDQESIDACNEKGMAMLFSKIRHFKH